MQPFHAAAGRFLLVLVTLTVCVEHARAVMIGKVYWSDSHTGTIMQSNLNGTDRVTILSGLGDVFNVHVAGERIYWTQTAGRQLMQANLDGSNPGRLVWTGGYAGRPAVDLENGLIYWAERTTNRIRIANLDGTNAHDLISTGLNGPHALDLDIVNQKLYWTEGTKVRRANLDGTGITDLISTSPVTAVDVKVDPISQRMYYVAGTRIISADLDGENQTVLQVGGQYPSFLALDQGADRIYWADQGRMNVASSRTDGTDVQEIANSDVVGFPTGIAVIPLPEPVTWVLLSCSAVWLLRRTPRQRRQGPL